MQQTIILIEDSESLGSLIKELLEIDGFNVTWFTTFDEAFDYIDNFHISDAASIAAIIFDYMLDQNNSKITSIPLVEMMRDMGYERPMIANSSDELFNSWLRDAGCTHIRPNGNKVDVVKFIMEQGLAS